MSQPVVIADRYRVVRSLGRGGMGTVWLCEDPVLGRQVAVKQIAAGAGIDGKSLERARREARTVAAITNPNVVQIHDIVEDDEQLWLVMEYVESVNLQELITERGPMDQHDVIHIGAQLADGLAAAHAAGVVHRDVKPANILITPEGDAKLVDFGIARRDEEAQVTLEGVMSGTPVYFSPELARTGEPDPPSDVWALGATLFAAVEGQAPFDEAGTPVAMLHRVIETEPRETKRAGILEGPISRLMERDPKKRWTSAKAAEELRAFDVISETSSIAAAAEDTTASPLQESASAAVSQAVESAPRMGPVAAAAGLPGRRGTGPRHAADDTRGKVLVVAVVAGVLLVIAIALAVLLG